MQNLNVTRVRIANQFYAGKEGKKLSLRDPEINLEMNEKLSAKLL